MHMMKRRRRKNDAMIPLKMIRPMIFRLMMTRPMMIRLMMIRLMMIRLILSCRILSPLKMFRLMNDPSHAISIVTCRPHSPG